MSTLQEFRNQHTSDSRKFAVTNSWGIRDAYKLIRKNHWFNIGRPLKESEFYHIIREVNNLLAEEIEAPIVATFRRYAMQVKEKPSEEEWRELCDLVDKTVPNFHAILSNNGELPSHYYRLCCLVRLGFDNTDIKVLISENLSNITRTYKNLHRKILQAPGSAKDFKNFIRRIGQEQLS
jgi:hypothetical protein